MAYVFGNISHVKGGEKLGQQGGAKLGQKKC
jgi:hypothetical protein